MIFGLTENEAMSKMISITRHDSVDGLSNYLREKKMLPKVYTQKITIDFKKNNLTQLLQLV